MRLWATVRRDAGSSAVLGFVSLSLLRAEKQGQCRPLVREDTCEAVEGGFAVFLGIDTDDCIRPSRQQPETAPVWLSPQKFSETFSRTYAKVLRSRHVEAETP